MVPMTRAERSNWTWLALLSIYNILGKYRKMFFMTKVFYFSPRSVSEAKNVSYISMPNVRGHEEDDFLKMLDVQVSELEVRAMRQSVQNYNFILSKIPRFSLRPRFWSGTQRQFH